MSALAKLAASGWVGYSGPAGGSSNFSTDDVFSSFPYTGTGAARSIINSIDFTNSQEITYTTAGTYSWTCPVGVTSISAVCIGGGGAGGSSVYNGSIYVLPGGGGGAGLGWKNNIAVTPGQTYTVVVGAAGSGGAANGGAGGDSYFINASTVKGGGGGGGIQMGAGGAGGTWVGDGGGNGGAGGAGAGESDNSISGGGGGAGGYSGDGGNGGIVIGGQPQAGQGATLNSGGAGGGSTASSDTGGYRVGAGSGGGVSVFGKGTTGSATPVPSGGTVAPTITYGGLGGSGGSSGTNANGEQSAYIAGGAVGSYGGGGGGGCISPGAGKSGGSGAVRLMWGSGKAFPSTNAAALIDPTKGGMVWFKQRNSTSAPRIYDTVQGPTSSLDPSTYTPKGTAGSFVGFNNNGFSLTGTNATTNASGSTYSSWSFKRTPKFFDIVTWTGDGTSDRAIPHNLGIAPGMVMVKTLSTSDDWYVSHRSQPGIGYLTLNSTAAFTTTTAPNQVGFDATNIYVHQASFPWVQNAAGVSYIAYVFAHDTAVDSSIKCDSITTDASGNATVILDFEPQWLLVRSVTAGSNWIVVDTSRGWTVDAGVKSLYANTTGAEINNATSFVGLTNTGFKVASSTANAQHLFMAIRRSNKTPTTGTQVYNALVYSGNNAANRALTGAGFRPDSYWFHGRTAGGNGAGKYMYDRLRGGDKGLTTTSAAVEDAAGILIPSFDTDGVTINYSGNTRLNGTGYSYVLHMFKRAKGFFDEVCYAGTTGNLGQPQTIPHSLGTVPQLIINKARTAGGYNSWDIWSPTGLGTALTASEFLNMNSAAKLTLGAPAYYAATETNFGTDNAVAGTTYSTYLFGTVPSVSKVGSYMGDGSILKNIDCGFSNGARFVMIKRTDQPGDWFVWDSVRGITAAGVDPHNSLNTTVVEVTTDNSIDPLPAGFSVIQNATTNMNVGALSMSFVLRTAYVGTANLQSAAFGNGIAVAVGDAGVVTRSTDNGITWAAVTAFTGAAINGVTYGNGKFVAVTSGSQIFTSIDGLTWSGPVVVTSPLYAVGFGNGVFVAAGTAYIVTSSDAVTWTVRDNFATSEQPTNIAFGNNTFVVVCNAQQAMRSTDNGVTWTSTALNIGRQLSSVGTAVTFANGKFVAGSDYDSSIGMTAIVVSTDNGLTWGNSIDSKFAGNWVLDLSYSNGIFYAAGTGGQMATSNDALAWTLVPGITSVSSNWIQGSAPAANGSLIFPTQNGKILTSPPPVPATYIFLAIA